MNHFHNQRSNSVAAFVAGQIVMLGIVYLFRPAAASAHADADPIVAPSLILRKGSSGSGIQITATGAAGGPGMTFFDASGASRMQLSLDGTGKPTVILRGKTGDVAIGIGMQGDDRATIAIRGPKGSLVTLPVPDN